MTKTGFRLMVFSFSFLFFFAFFLASCSEREEAPFCCKDTQHPKYAPADAKTFNELKFSSFQMSLFPK